MLFIYVMCNVLLVRSSLFWIHQAKKFSRKFQKAMWVVLLVVVLLHHCCVVHAVLFTHVVW